MAIQNSTCRRCSQGVVLNERVSNHWLHSRPGNDHPAEPSASPADPWGTLSYEQYAPLLLSERVWLAAATEEEFSARVLHPADRLFDEIGTKGAEWSQGPANAQRISEIVGALVATTRIILARGIALRLEPFVERLRRGSSRTSAARLLVAITMDRFTLPEAVERQFVAALQEYNGADLLKYAIGARPSDNYKILLDVVRDLIEERDAKGISADIVKLAPDAIREAAKANDLLASLMRE